MSRSYELVREEEIPQMFDLWKRSGVPMHEVVGPIIGAFDDTPDGRRMRGFVARRPVRENYTVMEPLVVDPELPRKGFVIIKLTEAFASLLPNFVFRVHKETYPGWQEIIEKYNRFELYSEQDGYAWFAHHGEIV